MAKSGNGENGNEESWAWRKLIESISISNGTKAMKTPAKKKKRQWQQQTAASAKKHRLGSVSIEKRRRKIRRLAENENIGEKQIMAA
jgi:hypothetical protein